MLWTRVYSWIISPRCVFQPLFLESTTYLLVIAHLHQHRRSWRSLLVLVLPPWLGNLRSAPRVIWPLGEWRIVPRMMRVIRIRYVFPRMSCLQTWWSYGSLILANHKSLPTPYCSTPKLSIRVLSLTNSMAAIVSSRSWLLFHLHPFHAIFKPPTSVLERKGGYAMRLA